MIMKSFLLLKETAKETRIHLCEDSTPNENSGLCMARCQTSSQPGTSDDGPEDIACTAQRQGSAAAPRAGSMSGKERPEMHLNASSSMKFKPASKQQLGVFKCRSWPMLSAQTCTCESSLSSLQARPASSLKQTEARTENGGEDESSPSRSAWHPPDSKPALQNGRLPDPSGSRELYPSTHAQRSDQSEQNQQRMSLSDNLAEAGQTSVRQNDWPERLSGNRLQSTLSGLLGNGFAQLLSTLQTRAGFPGDRNEQEQCHNLLQGAVQSPPSDEWIGAYHQLRRMGYGDYDIAGHDLKQLCSQFKGDVSRIVNFLCEPSAASFSGDPRLINNHHQHFEGALGQNFAAALSRPSSNEVHMPSQSDSSIGSVADAMAKLRAIQSDILRLPEQHRQEAISHLSASQAASGSINFAQLAQLVKQGRGTLGLGDILKEGGGLSALSTMGISNILNELGDLPSLLQGGFSPRPPQDRDPAPCSSESAQLDVSQLGNEGMPDGSGAHLDT